MSRNRGIIAAGHLQSARAAREMLLAGGNAFDAVLAAHITACVAEPVLTSLGGGAFLLARTAAGEDRLYDCFVHTPRRRRPPQDTDCYPIVADFGPATQQFHIGHGAMAVPGLIRGLFAASAELGRLPISMLFEPAIALARDGIVVTPFQEYLFQVVAPILVSTPEAARLFCSDPEQHTLLRAGEIHRQPELAGTLEALAREGAALFYEGEIGQQLARDCRQSGGHLREDDLCEYQVVRRDPLHFTYRGARLSTNPAPSSGGVLIALAMSLLQRQSPRSLPDGPGAQLRLLAEVMREVEHIRERERIGIAAQPESDVLTREILNRAHGALSARATWSRGTTHVSVIDREGNVAAMTASNGEGAGYVIPGTGVMVNNMLGEEDIMPHGLADWPTNTRISSMMAPTLGTRSDGGQIATGSGGSNRIRSAIVQTLINLLDHGMRSDDAVHAPRIHLENDLLSIEGGFDSTAAAQLAAAYPRHKIWDDRNLFFGGAHTVCAGPGGVDPHGAGDPRRGGVSLVA